MSKKIISSIVSVSLSFLFSSIAFAASAGGAYFVENPRIYDHRSFTDSSGNTYTWATVSDDIHIVLSPMLSCSQQAQLRLYVDGIDTGNFAQNCSGRRIIASGGGNTPYNTDPAIALAQLSESLNQYLASHNFSIQGTLTNPDGSQTVVNISDFELIDFSQGPVGLMALIPREWMTLTKDPVNIASGESVVYSQEFLIKAVGLPLSLSRSYRSFSTYSGVFGFGWRTDLDINLSQNSNGDVTIYRNDGSAIYFLNKSGGYLASPGNYSTLIKNPDNTFKLTDKHGIVSIYGSNGRLSSVTDRNGNVLRLSYNPSVVGGTYIQDASGRRISLTLDTSGRIISALDPEGNRFEYSYDGNGNLISIKDPAGAITSYAYDGNHKMTQFTNANGHKAYFQYDQQGRVVMNWQDNNVNKISLEYKSNHVTVTTDSLGNKNTYVFNDHGLLLDHVDAKGAVSYQSWDALMNRVAFTDANGNLTTFDNDGFGNLVQITDPRGGFTRMTYTSAFNLIASHSNYGRQTTYEYDVKGNLVSMTDALGNKDQYTYDQYGNQITEKDALGRQTSFTYDLYGRLLRRTDALGGKTNFTYSLSGNLLSETDALNNKTSYLYDKLNRLTKITFPNATTVQLTYDLIGHQTSTTNQKGNKTSKTYDLYDRLSQIIDPKGGITVFGYDSEGRVVTLTDAKGNQTKYFYDGNSRVVQKTDALNVSVLYTYDSNGNVLSETDANGHTTSYTYDELNRLKKTTYPDSSTVTFNYDLLGRRTSMGDATGQTNYSYDVLDRILSITGPGNSNIITYTYDAVGNLLTVKDQNNRTIAHGYDALDRLATVQDQNGVTKYSYDAVSNKKTVKYPNGVTENYTYDKLRRVLTAVNKTPASVAFSSFTNVYDAAGMITKKTYKDGTWSAYTYDALNQLLSETRRSSGTVLYSNVYTYDAVGNRSSWIKNTTLGLFWSSDHSSMPPQVLTNITSAGYGSTANPNQAVALKRNYNYNNANRLLNWDFAVTINASSFPVQTNTYTYDNNGNRLTKNAVLTGQAATPQQISYEYDHENQLKKLTYLNIPNIPGTQTDTISYSGDGQRTKLVTNGLATSYLYDRDNILIERNGTDSTLKQYTRGLDAGGGIGGLIAQNTIGANAAVVYYQYDDLGSSSNLTSSSGTLASSYSYDPFGNLLSSKNSSDTNRYLFSTKEFDSRSGLYYFGARYYDPEVGRWLTPDPMGFVDGMNLYAYVNNNPINLIDPYGYLGERISNLFEDIDWVSLTDSQREELHEAIIMASLGVGGRTVLGHYPEYIAKAEKIGAHYLQVGKWSWPKNAKFLDSVVARGDQVIVSTQKALIRAGSTLEREIMYLRENGYKWINQWSLKIKGK